MTTPGRAERMLQGHVAMGGLAQSLAGVAGAMMAEELGGSPAFAGLPQTLLVVGAALSAVPLSMTAERFGRAWSLAAGGLSGAVGCAVALAGAAHGTVWGVLLGSVLLGTGNVSVMLARYAGAEVRPDQDRARAVAGVLVWTTVGAVAGPNLLAAAPQVARPVALPDLAGAYVMGGLAYLAAALVALGLRAGLRPADAPGPEAGPDAASRPRLPAGLDPTAVRGAIVLALSNLVMVGVMTMAPPHLHDQGVSLAVVGLVVSLHIAGMFAPSALSGRLVQRLGGEGAGRVAAATLTGACVLAAVVDGTALFAAAMVLLGVGWNLALVSGSVMLTGGATPAERPRREALGEVCAALAAALGGVGSGSLVVAGGYPVLASAGGVCAVALATALAWQTSRRGPERDPASCCRAAPRA